MARTLLQATSSSVSGIKKHLRQAMSHLVALGG